MEIWASPTSRHYAEGSAIYNPSHILDYQKIHEDNLAKPNLTPLLPEEGNIISGFPEKSETHFFIIYVLSNCRVLTPTHTVNQLHNCNV